MRLGLSADELLTTTRAVRMRLDFDHEVARGAIASGGPSDTESWNDPLLQECVSVVRTAIRSFPVASRRRGAWASGPSPGADCHP